MIGRGHPASIEREEDKQRALPSTRNRQRPPAVIENLQRTEKANLHDRNLLTGPVDRQRTASATEHRQLVEPHPSDDDDATPGIDPRRRRQQAEILRLVVTQQLHRAADLSHEHLAEFPGDYHIRRNVMAALDASADPHLRRRSGEFLAP
jgi:hypothetical protein